MQEAIIRTTVTRRSKLFFLVVVVVGFLAVVFGRFSASSNKPPPKALSLFENHGYIRTNFQLLRTMATKLKNQNWSWQDLLTWCHF